MPWDARAGSRIAALGTPPNASPSHRVYSTDAAPDVHRGAPAPADLRALPPLTIASPTPFPARVTPPPAPGDREAERQLIEQVLAGDRRAARVLYDAHVLRVHRVAYRLTGDEPLAQECTQEAFVRAFTRLDRFRGDAALGTWLTRIAVTVSLNAIRRRRRRGDREVGLDEVVQLHASEAPAIEPDLRERVARAIDALPEIYRTTVVLHDVEGYTHAEIASVLGVPEGTCKTRLFVARRKLREMLADFVKE
ncbi:MAG TPA: RNA polymerase sigma factor [Gemmatimonadaceae bacterium]|nr:RNA polymerase sigma factor [Gemmatimonadaceae bacterium]